MSFCLVGACTGGMALTWLHVTERCSQHPTFVFTAGHDRPHPHSSVAALPRPHPVIPMKNSLEVKENSINGEDSRHSPLSTGSTQLLKSVLVAVSPPIVGCRHLSTVKLHYIRVYVYTYIYTRIYTWAHMHIFYFILFYLH